MPGFVKNEIELERDVQKELAAWKRKRHNTVLQVEGPRQVGKTHEIKKFTYSHYNNVIYINLVRDEYGFEDLLSESSGSFMAKYCEQAGLSPYSDNENTVLVIDEIQESQMVYNSIRDLRERLSCDIIISGSYLARTVNSKDFFLPAGIAYLRMYPLSFQEFCRARDCEDILEQLHPFGESPSGNYERLERKYQIYRHIGGYPQVVTTYIKTEDESDCLEVLGDLVRTFIAESSRFFSNSTALSIFNEVYKSIMVQIAEEKKEQAKHFWNW